MDGGNDGTLLDQWRYILDAGALDWVGCCDHDNGGGREYTWWLEQKLTDIFYTPGHFAPMFNYERSVAYPEGHRNVIFAAARHPPAAAAAHLQGSRPRQSARHADALRVPEILRRRRGIAHQRHQHGHGLARQRSATGARGRDLPGRPAELRNAGRAAQQFRERRHRRMAAEGIRQPGAGERIRAGVRSQLGPRFHAHQLRQRAGDGRDARGAAGRPAASGTSTPPPTTFWPSSAPAIT